MSLLQTKTTCQNSSNFSGVRIKPIPKDIDHGQIVEFLINSGLPETYKENISIKDNGSVLLKLCQMIYV